MSAEPGKIRIDKWLWYARFFKTRGLAAKVVSAGHVRVNGARISKPAQTVGRGDVLTFPQARSIRVVRVLLHGLRRGPATEARTLYEDLAVPVQDGDDAPDGLQRRGGRPTKRDRRAMDRLKPG